MLEFNRTELEHLAVHYTGNMINGEEFTTAKSEFQFKEDLVKDALMQYFLKPFKNDVYYQFRKPTDLAATSVHTLVREIFEDKKRFFANSKKIAKHLYEQSVHPKIKGGEFYLAYFRDVKVDGELTDAIGIFKSESRETYLKVFQHLDEFDIESDQGININKLDKGCLIYNTEKEMGFKASIVDTGNRIAEAAFYWIEDFLNLKLREDNYYHTQNIINMCKGFCEEVLTEENNVERTDQMMVLNRSLNYLKEKDRFKMKDFEKEVMVQPEVIEAFRDYSKNFIEEHHIKPTNEFDVSETALRKNQKYMRAVIKLDRNFHIYVHGQHEYIKKGYDEEARMKYYKLYFNNEE